MPTATPDTLQETVLREALAGLTASPKTLPPWLFYDEHGSRLFEQITELPEYYLTRTERAIFAANAEEIIATARAGRSLTLVELGAGSSSKTGILLRAAVAQQGSVLYQPIDVSASALEEAAASIAANIAGVVDESQVANYITDRYSIARPPGQRVLALYIGSSIGNFSPEEQIGILRNLRDHLEPGDTLLLGADRAPGPRKSIAALEAAYDDAQGVTAAFNLNILTRLNRELGADFNLNAFTHRAMWNASASRMEMHLVSLAAQTVHIDGQPIRFAAGETIHTENSHKFTAATVAELLRSSGFIPRRMLEDPDGFFAVTLAEAVS